MKRGTMNMINWYLQESLGRARSAAVPFATLAMWVLNGACPVLAQQSVSPTFPSAAEASQTLFQAVQRNDVEAVTKILGGTSELASSGDTAQDKADREVFVQKYQEMHRLGREADGSVALYIGAENWPFPIPMVEKNGVWRFDADTGRKEVLYRRIGENELTAIVICHELVAAETQHRANPKAAVQADSQLASLVTAAASGSASPEPVLMHGYYFRAVANRGADGKTAAGFGFVAYPAEYRSSGVMSFLVTEKDVVKEKDLGANTSALAGALAGSRKETGWVLCDDK
jgi:hypothetical protein